MVFVKITLTWRQKILQKYLKKKHVLKTHLIHRFSLYSLEVDVGHLGADFRPLGIIFSPESHYWVFISCLLELIMGLWESIFCVCGSIVGLWESTLGLYKSILGLWWSSLGLCESISCFLKQFGPQEVGGGYLEIDFGALRVNFSLWDSI